MAPPHRRRRRNSFPAIDRLSALPDSVLTHLLSFLPTTKMCVATSVLSKRWRFLWRYVPIIDLLDAFRLNQDTVSRVVSLHKVQRLDAFRLNFNNANDNSDSRQIEEWIIAAVERNVRELHLRLSRIYVLPSPLFTCQTLVDLRLDCCGLVPSNLTAVSFPRLKNLHLVFIRFEASESLTRLISGCPALEELKIRYVVYGDLVRFIISSPTIKRLKLILKFSTFGGRDYSHDYTLQLDTPALEDLLLDDGLSEQIDSGPLISLIKADIAFSYREDEVEDVFRCYRSALNFVNKLSEVKSLTIYLVYDEDIPSLMATTGPVTFNNLTKLDLAARNPFLPKFLENAPNLQFLSFREHNEEDMQIEPWIEPQCVPTCLLYTLRTITIGSFYAVPNEIEMIRYLLKNGRVLETMEMRIWRGDSEYDSEEEAAVEEILLFERGSETCELKFS